MVASLLSLLICRFKINLCLFAKNNVYPEKFATAWILLIAYPWPFTYFSVLFISYKLVIVSENCVVIFLRKLKKNTYRYTLEGGMELLILGTQSSLAF